MEPDGLNELLNELKSYLYNKFQKYGVSDTKLTQAYLEALSEVGSLTGSGHSSAHYWLEQNEVQQYTWDDYNGELKEEIEDNDLGLVRKLNLN